MSNRQAVGTNQSNSQTTQPFSVAATLAGSLLVLFSYFDGSGSITSITDNAGNTWVRAYTPTNHPWFEVWYCPNAIGGVTSGTITYSAAADSQSIFLERDDALTSPLDQMKVETAQGGVTAFSTSAAPTTSRARTVGIGCHSTFTSAGIVFSPGSGWTPVSGTGLSGGAVAASGHVLYMQTQDFSTTGAYSSDGTVNSAADVRSSLLLFDLADPTGPPSYPIRSDNWF